MSSSLVFETARLRLRPIESDDSDEWWEAIWSDAEVARFLRPRKPVPRDTMPARMERVAQHWQTHRMGIWSVRDEHGLLIGHCGLLLNEPPRVELVYAIARRVWGRGLATEAAGRLVTYALEERKVDELIAGTFPDNTASMRVLEKLEFVRSGFVEQAGEQFLLFVRNR